MTGARRERGLRCREDVVLHRGGDRRQVCLGLEVFVEIGAFRCGRRVGFGSVWEISSMLRNQVGC